MTLKRKAAAALILCLGYAAVAQVTNTTIAISDAFLCTGAPGNPEMDGADLSGLNFGAAGTLVVAPAASVKGEFQSVVEFDLSSDVALFNQTYGSNHWFVSGLSLRLASNYGTSGVQPNNGIFPKISAGNFVIEWLSDNDWPEGTGTPNLPTTDGVTYDSLAQLLAGPREILCTNSYTPPGNNVPVIYTLPLDTNLVAAATSGGQATLLFYAADNQIAYLFNSHTFGNGNQPQIRVVASPLIKIISASITNGGFALSGVGPVNTTYQIQANASLSATNWQTIGTAASDGNGAIQFHDSAAANQPTRFYRIAQ